MDLGMGTFDRFNGLSNEFSKIFSDLLIIHKYPAVGRLNKRSNAPAAAKH